MMQLEPLLSAIVAHRKEIPADPALLVAISGIDGSGTSFTDLEFPADEFEEKFLPEGFWVHMNGPKEWRPVSMKARPLRRDMLRICLASRRRQVVAQASCLWGHRASRPVSRDGALDSPGETPRTRCFKISETIRRAPHYLMRSRIRCALFPSFRLRPVFASR